MKNLNMLVMDCKTELDNLDIEYGFIQSVTVNTRAKKRCTLVGQSGAIKRAISTNYVSTKRTFLQELLDGEWNDSKRIKRNSFIVWWRIKSSR